ncbi:MAG: peptidase domain-containing ABC transporter [Eubacterium sp.]|nr:peptidase domain-containing ABC transporter [Eubacterium sp.]
MKYILVRQHDENDCGIACLTMLCRFYKSKISYNKIRKLINCETNGISIEELINGAEAIGFKAKALKGNIIELQEEIRRKKIRFPFIAHTTDSQNTGHYVVIYHLSNKKVVIANPNGSLEKKSLNAFKQMWTGYIINLYPTDQLKQEHAGNILQKNLISYFRKNKLLISVILMINGISLLFDFISSQIISIIVDCLSGVSMNKNINQSFTNKFSESFSLKDLYPQQIRTICIFIILFGILDMFIMFFSKYFKSVLDKRTDREIMNTYFSKLLDAPLGFNEKIMSGDIMSRFYDITVIKNMMMALSLELSVSIITFLASGIFLAFVSKILFSVIILILSLYLVVMLLFNKSLERTAKNELKNEAILTSFIKETIDGMDIIKYNTCENHFHSKFQKLLDDFLGSIQKNALLVYSHESLNTWITFMGNILILGIGIYLCVFNYITIGVLVSFMYIMYFFLNPVQKLAYFQGIYKNGMAALERINDIIETKIEYSGKNTFPEFDKLRYKKVEFRYTIGKFGLENINLNIVKGQNIAIVGKSGSGKTSLVKLLVSGTIQEGSIFIGTTDISDIQLKEIRNNIVYLPQKSFVFSGTIKDNILLGRDDISEDYLNKVCKICLGTEINAFPNQGLDMYISENGKNLSEGQVQRIALARSIINSPKILILDEATSNLDLYSEQFIMKKLQLLLAESTIIVITHRLHFLDKFDNIVFMENGRIIKQGTHNELIRQSSAYSYFIKKETQNG